VKLFVYGSLLSGEDNHRHLARCKFVGERRTVAAYTLIDLGGYPALLPEGTTSVFGEIYEVDPETLSSLDAFEGHPVVYRRDPIRLIDGETASAYVLRQRRLALGRPVIASGDWRRRRG
jgi:gamma-glutamylcyclotransferase (GGCT)/AIG2-like uncharacterized protein YtfP